MFSFLSRSLFILLAACAQGPDALANPPPPATASPPSVARAPRPWADARAGDVLTVTLADLRPTQGGLGFDQVYSRLGRYEADAAKKFDDFCADEGLGGVRRWDAASTLRDAASFACRDADGRARDASALAAVVVGPDGATLHVIDGHHGLSAWYELPDGGAGLVVHVAVRETFATLAGAAFWDRMRSAGFLWLRDGHDRPITVAQLPRGLGLHQGLSDDAFRSLVYFARGVGYARPAASPDYLEFQWARWLRAQPGFRLEAYDLRRLADVADPTAARFDPAADGGYLGAVWQASQRMVAATDPVIAGKSGADLGRLDALNAGKAAGHGAFGDLMRPAGAARPGKLAHLLRYKARRRL
ncbi:MAG: ParB/Srx family N-terminal domain-containing protein [Candidatus Dactylopiibacterium sp.]|nr:ParB/Srx family N-terminal domain-containing protein [Candidatus Dactylopiibacterium sp.]